MRLVLVVVGIVLALMGSVWALQGAGFLLGSFMSNDPTWIGIGAATVVVGVVLLLFGSRSKPALPQPPR